MNVNEPVTVPVTVTLDARQWFILLGWIEAHRLDPEESIVLTDIFVGIAKTLRNAA